MGKKGKKKVSEKKKDVKKAKKVAKPKATPNVTTRNAAKKDPNFKHTAPITQFRRKNARPLSVKSGNMSNQTVAQDDNNDDLSKEEKMLLMQSQPQDAISEDDS